MSCLMVRCDEPTAGAIDTGPMGGWMPVCAKHIPDMRADVATISAAPGIVPCECSCGCACSDAWTDAYPWFDPLFRCHRCWANDHVFETTGWHWPLLPTERIARAKPDR